MDLTTLRVYILNISAITVSTFDLIEDSLKIILLVVSIAYTAQKWWQLRSKKMRRINKIIVHCTATPEGRDVTINEVRDWHVNDNGWRDVGYHFLIRLDGTVEEGRPIEQTGAHCYGNNWGQYRYSVCWWY